MTRSTPSEEDDFGDAFANLLTDVQGTVREGETRKLTADTGYLTMLVDSAVSGHYFDDELHPGLKVTVLSYKELEIPYNIVTAGRHVLLGTASGTASGEVVYTDGKTHRVGDVYVSHHRLNPPIPKSGAWKLVIFTNSYSSVRPCG